MKANISVINIIAYIIRYNGEYMAESAPVKKEKGKLVIRLIQKRDVLNLLNIGKQRTGAPLERGGLPWGLAGMTAQSKKRFKDNFKKQ